MTASVLAGRATSRFPQLVPGTGHQLPMKRRNNNNNGTLFNLPFNDSCVLTHAIRPGQSYVLIIHRILDLAYDV